MKCKLLMTSTRPLLARSSVLIALYSVRSDRQFCEQLDYNILFRFDPATLHLVPVGLHTTHT